MWNSPEEMQTETLDVIQAALHHGYYTIANELQKADISNLQKLLDRITEYKRQAQERKDELAANLAFIMSRYAYAVSEYISMWVYLRHHKLEKAWLSLIEAQEHIRCAIRLRELDGFAGFNNRLHLLEKLLFPPAKYLSHAPQFEWSECSICGKRYGDCDHLALRLYMGEMCRRIVHNITGVDHVAIVDEPNDKRLRFPDIPRSLTGRPLLDEDKPSKKKKKRR